MRSWRVVTGRPPLFYHRPSTCLLLGLIISFSPTAFGWVVRPLPSVAGQSRRSWTIVGGLDKLSMRIIRLMWARRYYQECTMSKIVRRLNRCKMIIHIRQLNHQPSWSRRSFFPRGALSPLSPSSSNLYPLILSSIEIPFQGRGLQFQRFLMGIDITRSCETMINLEDNWIGVWPRNTVISIRLTFYGQWREFPHYRSQLSITANEFVSALLFIGPSRRETELISNVEIFYAFGTVMKGLCHFAGKITISTCVSISSTWCRPPQNKKDSHKIVSWASKQLEEIWYLSRKLSILSTFIHGWPCF